MLCTYNHIQLSCLWLLNICKYETHYMDLIWITFITLSTIFLFPMQKYLTITCVGKDNKYHKTTLIHTKRLVWIMSAMLLLLMLPSFPKLTLINSASCMLYLSTYLVYIHIYVESGINANTTKYSNEIFWWWLSVVHIGSVALLWRNAKCNVNPRQSKATLPLCALLNLVSIMYTIHLQNKSSRICFFRNCDQTFDGFVTFDWSVLGNCHVNAVAKRFLIHKIN